LIQFVLLLTNKNVLSVKFWDLIGASKLLLVFLFFLLFLVLLVFLVLIYFVTHDKKSPFVKYKIIIAGSTKEHTVLSGNPLSNFIARILNALDQRDQNY